MHQELNSPKGFSLTGLISLLIYYFHMPQQAAIYLQNNQIKSSWAAHWFSNIKSVDRRKQTELKRYTRTGQLQCIHSITNSQCFNKARHKPAWLCESIAEGT